jgi:hypothetical protein
VRKIESELYRNDGRVVSPEEVTLDMVSWRTLGPGCIGSGELFCSLLLDAQ